MHSDSKKPRRSSCAMPLFAAGDFQRYLAST